MKSKQPIEMQSTQTQQIATLCHDLKIPAFFQAYVEQNKSPEFADKAYSDRLLPMLLAERQSRAAKRIARNTKESGINDALPDLSRITYESSRGLKKSQVDELARCDWLRQDRALNTIVTGMTGTGKTWLVKALGKAALQAGFKVFYIRTPQLIERLRIARRDNEMGQYRMRLNSKKLLILDDFAMTPMDDATKDDFLSLIDDRQEDGPMIIASQRPFAQWYEYLGTGLHADAILDRFKNTSYVIELKGRSLRETTALAKKLRNEKKERA